ncbi:MAG TPA: RsmB/NOP family class I SAM-dependent RNA methyltransferase [Candidatus Cybelea sp.]|nr:RsmB/NOP family class I SAM-dependent RNA methyltransferase [Candidatus Cybelea sp.]
MQPAIDLLQAINDSSKPADAVIANFLRDRDWLTGHARGVTLRRVDDVLRRRSQLDWWIAREARGLPPTARLRMIAHLIVAEGQPIERIETLFDGGRYRPRRLDEREQAFSAAVANRSLLDPAMPSHVRGSFPQWLEPHLREAFGDDLDIEMQALAAPAPLDLRVNTLKSTLAAARALIRAQGVEADPTPLSPVGLRVAYRIDLGQFPALHDGVVEPQDEGSQVAALLTAAGPGQFVVDYCAGVGGKSLALAAAMQGRGRIVAADVLSGRLQRARQRFKRAGAHNIETRETSSERKWFKRQAGRVDRVLVDAPCSGIGSWRRIPDARWRLRPGDIGELVRRQAEILREAAKLVRPGGRLVYVTCSVLRCENAGQVEAFLADHGAFSVKPIAAVWGETIGGSCPTDAPYLQLTPARHGTGGFFVAILERKATD